MRIKFPMKVWMPACQDPEVVMLTRKDTVRHCEHECGLSCSIPDAGEVGERPYKKPVRATITIGGSKDAS